MPSPWTHSPETEKRPEAYFHPHAIVYRTEDGWLGRAKVGGKYVTNGSPITGRSLNWVKRYTVRSWLDRTKAARKIP